MDDSPPCTTGGQLQVISIMHTFLDMQPEDAQQYESTVLTSSRVQGPTLRAAAAATSLPTLADPVKLSCNRQETIQCSSLFDCLVTLAL